jgi:hypothetical protein
MNDNLLGNNLNLNESGFNDDSMLSDGEDNARDDTNFLLKSNTNNQSVIDKALTVKDNNSKSFSGEFEILNPDNDLLNNNNRNSSEPMVEDVFSNNYIIPLNRPHKFSISKMGHQFIFESNSRVNTYKIEKKKFALSRNSQISTYLLSLFIFSEFLNLDELEKDNRFKVNFVKRNPQQKKFIIDDVNPVLSSLEMPLERSNDFKSFINGINSFLTEEEFLNIQLKNKKQLFWVYLVMVAVIIGILSIAGLMYFSFRLENKVFLLVLEGVILLFFIIVLIIKIVDAYNLRILFIYNDLKYLILNYNKIYDYVEAWNTNLFENYKIRATVPISLNYIMFNLNPYQDIEIKHLDMNEIKKRFYKTQGEVFKTSAELNFFNAIKLALNNQPNVENSSSIN